VDDIVSGLGFLWVTS